MTPTINNYLESFTNPAGRFRSLSGVEILRETGGQPRYAVRSKTLDVAVRHNGRERILCCPLHGGETFDLRDYVRERYAEPQLLLGEMLVFDDRDGSVWQDILLADAPADAFLTGARVPREEDPFEWEEKNSVPVFREGLAAVEREGKYGYIDPNDAEIIPFRYDWADAFDEGLAVVKRGEGFGLIDKQGREIFAPEHEDLRWRSDNGAVFLCDEGKWTLHGRQGEPLSGETFDFIFDFSQGLASVRRARKYGYIDRTGAVAIPLRYDEAYSFSDEGLATVVKKGRTFCIDTEGMVFD